MSAPKERRFSPAALRFPWRAQPAFIVALACFLVAQHGLVAPLLDLTRPAEITLGIVAIAVSLWLSEAVPLFVTSLVVLGLELVWLAPSLAEARGKALFLNAFFSDVTLLFLGGFVLSAGIERAGIDRLLSRAILRRTGTEPARVMLGMMGATSMLGVWMSNTAACALMLGPVSSVLARLGSSDGLRKALLLGVAFSANLGGLPTPVSSPPNAIVMRYLESHGAAPSFGTWMLLAIPLVVAMQAILLLYLARRFPTATKQVVLDDAPAQPFGRAQWIVTITFVVTVLGWVVGSRFSITSGTVGLVPVVVFFGTELLRTADLRALPWDVILLIGGGLALGAAVDQSGLAAWVGGFIPTEGVPLFVIKGIVAVFAVGISSVMSNTAAINLIAPIVMSLRGVDPAPVLLIAAFACTLSMPLPVSTPPNAMVYGYRSAQSEKPEGEFTTRDMVVPGMTMTAIGLLLLAALAAFWFPLFGI